MIIVAEPEESDTDMLLSGPQGAMLSAMLRAMAVDEGDIYFCSALRRHTPLPDWAAIAKAGLPDLLRHHIALAAPQRILAFGRNIPPLLGNDTAQAYANLRNLNHDGEDISVLSAGSLAEMIRSASRRQRFWHSWLQWTEELT